MTCCRLRLALATGILLLSVSCKDKRDTPTIEMNKNQLTPPDQSYVVRGVVKSVSRPSNEIFIQHEAIPSFINAAGKQVGMPAMTMPFALADLPSEVAADDKVEFTFEVRWQTEPASLARHLTKLPPDTELKLK